MMVVHSALEAFAGGANSGRRRFVIQALGPGKDSGNSQVSRAMLKFHIHRVVIGITVPVAVDVEVREIFIRQPTCIGARSNAEVDVVASGVLLLAERQAGRRNREWL